MFGGLQTMWVIVLFDLPTESNIEKRDYRLFRKKLLEDGFIMMQYSVYMRHSSSEKNAQVHVNRVKLYLPADGEVRIIKITDKQFGRIEVFYGKKRRPIEKAPEQLSIF